MELRRPKGKSVTAKISRENARAGKRGMVKSQSSGASGDLASTATSSLARTARLKVREARKMLIMRSDSIIAFAGISMQSVDIEKIDRSPAVLNQTLLT